MTTWRVPGRSAARLGRADAGYRIGAGGFKLLSGAALAVVRPKPIPLVHPFLHRGSVAIIGGYSSSLKTWLAMDLAVSVGAGTAWLGLHPAQRGRVTYLSWEGEESMLCNRLQQLARGAGTELAKIKVSLCARPHGRMPDPPFFDALEQLAAHNDLIIIDSLSAATTGIDENSAAARAPLDRLHEIASDTRCSFLLVHHSGKGGNGTGKVDHRQSLRGSSAIFAAADEVLFVERGIGEPSVKVHHVKNRTGREAPAFWARLEDTPRGTTFRVVDEVDEKARVVVAQGRELQEAVMKFICENPRSNMTGVREGVGHRGVIVDQAIRALVEKGEVTNKRYALASALRGVRS